MFPEVDPVLGPEMRSTGEVLGLSTLPGLAFFKSEEAAQAKLPTSGAALITVAQRDRIDEGPGNSGDSLLAAASNASQWFQSFSPQRGPQPTFKSMGFPRRF